KQLAPRLRKLRRVVSHAHYVPGLDMIVRPTCYVYAPSSTQTPAQTTVAATASPPAASVAASVPARQSSSSSYAQRQRPATAYWGGQQYTGRVCSSPNCRMCNSIASQLYS